MVIWSGGFCINGDRFALVKANDARDVFDTAVSKLLSEMMVCCEIVDNVWHCELFVAPSASRKWLTRKDVLMCTCVRWVWPSRNLFTDVSNVFEFPYVLSILGVQVHTFGLIHWSSTIVKCYSTFHAFCKRFSVTYCVDHVITGVAAVTRYVDERNFNCWMTEALLRSQLLGWLGLPVWSAAGNRFEACEELFVSLKRVEISRVMPSGRWTIDI